MASPDSITHVKYEIFGKVQGVFFRKYTKKKADSLGIRGWVKNTTQNTVTGELQGQMEDVNKLKTWLKTEGSPKSCISKAVFEDQGTIKQYTYSNFSITK